MAPRMTNSTFKGCEGFPTIKQDHLALPRCILIGSMLADREAFRVGRPGMGVLDFHLIEDMIEREQYKRIVNSMKNVLKSPSTQDKSLHDFYTKFNIDTSWNSENDLEDIQERLKGCYRIVLFNYHYKSGLCSLVWAGQEVLAKTIFLITDGEKWDVASKKNGLYEGKFLCGGCLETSAKISYHRCKFMCNSCNSLLAAGNCYGDLNRRCEDCNFIFQTETCYKTHKFEPRRGQGSRCDTLKYCYTCRSIYKAREGVHNCFDENIYCSMCNEYTKNQHDCNWAPFTDKMREKLKKEQKKWKFAFYDMETDQLDVNPDGSFNYRDHYANEINMQKASILNLIYLRLNSHQGFQVCYLCCDNPLSDFCELCQTREVNFTYDPNDPLEDNYKVIDDFCEYIRSDSTMQGHTLFAHNAGRFDAHLVVTGFRRMGITPASMINKGSTLIRLEFKLRGRRRIVFKDSYCIIPMALGQFNKAFELDCEEKGIFPHFANTRGNRGRIWPSIPDRRFFGYENKTPTDQKKFDVWYETMIGKEWDQDKALIEYCRSDVTILMRGCLKFNQIMLEETGWSPLIVANTLPSFCQFNLRANFLNHKDFPYLPESGYGALNQSTIAIKYFKWLEHLHPERTYQHAHSPYGEKTVRVNHQNYSIDCFEDEKKIIEIHGCYYHGCPVCYEPGILLVGDERADVLFKRSEDRVNQLRNKFEVEVIWECKLRRMIAANREMKTFFDTVEVIERIRPRDALFGGRVEVFRSFLKATKEEVIKYYDIVSMYPFVQATMPFPLGHPKIIKSGFLPVAGCKLPYRGLIKLRILAPRSQTLAVLPVRHENYLFFGNCRSCMLEQVEFCVHEDECDRSFIGTYCTEEVEKALEQGYRILEIFEVWAWERFDDTIYREYFKQCMKLKFAASGFPADVVSDEQKAEYCKRVGAKLGFVLDPKDVNPSAARRYVAKLMANSAWGKLAEVATHSKTEYMSADAFNELQLDATRETVTATGIDHDLLLVTHRPVKETIRANRFSSVPHAVYVTCYARLLLYKVISAVRGTVAYCDTDSVVFTMPRDGEDPLAHMLTGEFGDLSDEMEDGWEIKEAVFAGCKNYSMLMENTTTGETKVKQALRGFTKDANTLEILSHKNISEMVLKKGDPDVPECLEITRLEMKRTMGRITSAPATKKYRPFSMKRATRGEGEEEFKVPFGYVDSD